MYKLYESEPHLTDEESEHQGQTSHEHVTCPKSQSEK